MVRAMKEDSIIEDGESKLGGSPNKLENLQFEYHRLQEQYKDDIAALKQ